MITGYSGSPYSVSSVSTVLSGVLGVASVPSSWGRTILAVTNSQQAPQTAPAPPHPLQPPQHVVVNGLKYLDKCNQKYGSPSPDGYYECVDYNWTTSDLQCVAQSYSTVDGGSNVISTHADTYHRIQTHENFLVVEASPPSMRAEASFHGSCQTYRQGDTIKFSTEVMAPYGWSRAQGRKSKYHSVITQFKMPSGPPHSEIILSNDGKLRLSYKGIDGEVYRLGGRLKQDQKTTIELEVRHSMNNDGSVRVKVNGGNRLTLDGIQTINRNLTGGYVKMGIYTKINEPRALRFGKTTICKAMSNRNSQK